MMAARNEELGQVISKEEGKVIAEGRGEANRAVETMMGSAEEAKRLHGETVPLDADPTGGKKFGFTLRVPCGVVAAIAPFNFPLNLVAHKVGPALAAGNSVIVKPASDTPLSALKLTEILLEAGLPAEGIQCITGSGGEIGDALVADRAWRKVTFTGSREVGERICHKAGIKKGDDGARFQQSSDHHAGCRPRKGRDSVGNDRVRQCRSNLYFDSAGAYREKGLRRFVKRHEAESRSADDRQPVG
jgi:acyl-CoA reductase-like NAD-dependent aldehyde dehydrogenase